MEAAAHPHRRVAERLKAPAEAVFHSSSRWPALVALLIAPAAVIGYLLGHRSHSVPAPAPRTHSFYAADTLLESPAAWSAATRVPTIPGLTLRAPVALAPRGDALVGGIIVGQLPERGVTPLPATLLARVSPAPHAEVVSLAETQAYRYANLRVAAFANALELYAIPRSGGGMTGVACYGPAMGSAVVRTCEQMVAALKLVGQPRGPNLSVERVYAGKLASLVGALDQQRQTLRQQMREHVSQSGVAQVAKSLSLSFAAAARSLSTLEAPLPAGRAHALLYHALHRAAGAYATLAGAAGSSNASYEAARTAVDAAEREVSAALEDYGLIGYGRA
jgi:hypothetical protein